MLDNCPDFPKSKLTNSKLAWTRSTGTRDFACDCYEWALSLALVSKHFKSMIRQLNDTITLASSFDALCLTRCFTSTSLTSLSLLHEFGFDPSFSTLLQHEPFGNMLRQGPLTKCTASSITDVHKLCVSVGISSLTSLNINSRANRNLVIQDLPKIFEINGNLGHLSLTIVNGSYNVSMDTYTLMPRIFSSIARSVTSLSLCTVFLGRYLSENPATFFASLPNGLDTLYIEPLDRYRSPLLVASLSDYLGKHPNLTSFGFGNLPELSQSLSYLLGDSVDSASTLTHITLDSNLLYFPVEMRRIASLTFNITHHIFPYAPHEEHLDNVDSLEFIHKYPAREIATITEIIRHNTGTKSIRIEFESDWNNHPLQIQTLIDALNANSTLKYFYIYRTIPPLPLPPSLLSLIECRKYVAAQFSLKTGEETGVAVEQFMREFDIPLYLSVSLMHVVDALLDNEYIAYKDNLDSLAIQSALASDTPTQTRLEGLAATFAATTYQWNSLLANEETAEQAAKEERIRMFLYLVNKAPETKEKIVNQEELFATAFNILLSKRKEDMQALNAAHSLEMQEACNNGAPSDLIEGLFSTNVTRLEAIEVRYDQEIAALKAKQKADFTSFLNDLYWLETTKDELDKVDEDLNGGKKELLQQQQQDAGKIGQIMDKGLARASSFFSFGFKKGPVQPGQGNNTSPSQTPPIQSPEISSQSPSKPIVIDDINNNNKPTPNRPRKDSSNSSTSPPVASPSKSAPPKIQPLYRVLESLQIAVGIQKKKIFEFRLIDASPLQLCRPVSTGEYLKSKRIEYIQTLYSDSLSAVILLADPSLSFSSHSEKNFIQYCNMSTELHFESIDEQIDIFKKTIGDTVLKTGDFFITKHSNLSDVQVVFHLLADSKHRTPWGESAMPTSSDLAKGLRNILLTASKYGIGSLTIPIALTEADVEMNVTNSSIANRTTSILSVVRASLTSLHEMTSIKVVQFSMPSSLDGGNTQGQGPDFKGSMTIDTEGNVLSSAGLLESEDKEFAKTVLSMLQDVNVITTSNKQDFKRLSVIYSDQTYIITVSNNKIFVVVQ
eukprot:gene14509-17126_t